jgi:hypothetical protein
MPDINEPLKKLDALKDNSPYAVPEGYFEGVPEKLREKIIINEKQAEKNLIRILKPQLALVASFAALFLLAYSVFKVFIPEKENLSLSKQEIYATLENELDDIDDATLVQYLDNNTKEQSYTDFNLTEQEIMEYLSEESSDMDLNLNEF